MAPAFRIRVFIGFAEDAAELAKAAEAVVRQVEKQARKQRFHGQTPVLESFLWSVDASLRTGGARRDGRMCSSSGVT
jgi:hypothetical protein